MRERLRPWRLKYFLYIKAFLTDRNYEMKYNEADLTEATKIISYLRSIRIYAAGISIFSLMFFAMKIFGDAAGRELYLLYFFTGIILVGGLSVIYRINHMTANIYGLSCIIAGGVFSFYIIYYRGDAADLFTGAGFIAGLLVIRHGVSLAFGSRARYAFSAANQKMVSFVAYHMKSLKKPIPDDKDVIHATHTDDRGKKRNLRIKFVDDVAWFLLDGHSAPLFADRNNVYISLLSDNPGSLNVSITVDNHDWLEAEFKPDDLRKYELWKDLA